MKDFSLCLAMIVKNEAQNLPLSLGPIKDCFDEIVVVDTGSSDKTVEILNDYQVKVIHHRWQNNFSLARNESIKASKSDFIFWLDADNQISPQGILSFKKQLQKHGPKVILWATEVVEPQGERLQQRRVFPKQDDIFFIGQVHEQLKHPKNIKEVLTDVEIRHWGYDTAAKAREKGLRNLEILLKMPETKKGDFYWLYQTGRTYYNLRDFQKASIWLEKAANSFSTNESLWAHVLILLSQAKKRLNNKIESEEALRKILVKMPYYGPVHYYLGRFLYEEGLFIEAAKHFEVAILLDPGDLMWGEESKSSSFRAAFLLGRIWSNMEERLQSAWQALKFAAQLDPKNPEPDYALALLALKKGQKTEARYYLKRSLQIAPNSRRVLQVLKKIESGKSYV